MPEPIKTLPLVFEEPKGRGKPPRHLADLAPAERKARLEELGLPGFRAAQLSTHYFPRLLPDPPRRRPGRDDRSPSGPARRARPRPPAGADDPAPHARGRPRHDAQDAV